MASLSTLLLTPPGKLCPEDTNFRLSRAVKVTLIKILCNSQPSNRHNPNLHGIEHETKDIVASRD